MIPHPDKISDSKPRKRLMYVPEYDGCFTWNSSSDLLSAKQYYTASDGTFAVITVPEPLRTMTRDQISAITTPVDGMIIHVSESNDLQIYHKGKWKTYEAKS